MLALDTGEPVLAIELVTAGTLKAADGRPVMAISEYATGTQTPDGRHIFPVAIGPFEGQPVMAASLYAAGTLQTPDGRPVMAVSGYKAGARGATLTPGLVDTLAARTAATAVWDVRQNAYRWQDIAGTASPVTAAGQAVGRLKAFKGGAAYDLVAPSDIERPLSTNGLTFDGSNDKLNFDFGGGAGPASMTVVSIIKTGPTSSVLYAYDGSNLGVIGQSGVGADAGGSAGGTTLVDGVVKAFRDDVFTAAYNNAAHTIEQRAGNFSAWPTFKWSGYPGLPFIGILLPVAVLDPAGLDYAAALTDAVNLATEIRTSLGL